jgi:hypothetical protein
VKEFNIIPELCKVLEFEDLRLIAAALEGLSNILVAYQKDSYFNPYAVEVMECGGLEKLNQLKCSQNSEIAEYTERVLQDHFGKEFELYLARKRGMLTKNASKC